MNTFDSTVNTTALVMVLGNAPSLTTIPDLALFLNGTINSTSVTVAYTGQDNLYALSFVPTTTGVYYLYCFGEIQARVNVMTRSELSYLQNIEDEAVGSWSWNKTDGTLTLVRQDGTTLHTYDVTDNLTSASRELIS